MNGRVGSVFEFFRSHLCRQGYHSPCFASYFVTKILCYSQRRCIWWYARLEHFWCTFCWHPNFLCSRPPIPAIQYVFEMYVAFYVKLLWLFSFWVSKSISISSENLQSRVLRLVRLLFLWAPLHNREVFDHQLNWVEPSIHSRDTTKWLRVSTDIEFGNFLELRKIAPAVFTNSLCSESVVEAPNSHSIQSRCSVKWMSPTLKRKEIMPFGGTVN